MYIQTANSKQDASNSLFVLVYPKWNLHDDLWPISVKFMAKAFPIKQLAS